MAADAGSANANGNATSAAPPAATSFANHRNDRARPPTCRARPVIGSPAIGALTDPVFLYRIETPEFWQRLLRHPTRLSVG